MVSQQHGAPAPPVDSQHPAQRKHSVILAPFPKTIGYIFPPKNCWLETTDGESVSVDVAQHSP